MLKDKRVIISELIEANKNELVILELQERFLSSKVILASPNKAAFELQLGRVQAVIRDKKEWISWLERYEKELKKEK